LQLADTSYWIVLPNPRGELYGKDLTVSKARSTDRILNKQIEKIRAEDMEVLVRYRWPGNVRELQNFIERSVILSSGPTLHPPLAELKRVARDSLSETRTLAAVEREQILQVLRETDCVIGGTHGAAAQLGVRRTTLLYRMRRLGISRPEN